MAEKKIWLTPTLSCYEIMTRPPFEDFLPDSGKVKNEEVRKKGLEGMVIAHKAGVKICYGSDLLVSMHALQVSPLIQISIPNGRCVRSTIWMQLH